MPEISGFIGHRRKSSWFLAVFSTILGFYSPFKKSASSRFFRTELSTRCDRKRFLHLSYNTLNIQIEIENSISSGYSRRTAPQCVGCFKLLQGKQSCSKCLLPVCDKKCERETNQSQTTKKNDPLDRKIHNFIWIKVVWSQIPEKNTPVQEYLSKKDTP